MDQKWRVLTFEETVDLGRHQSRAEEAEEEEATDGLVGGLLAELLLDLVLDVSEHLLHLARDDAVRAREGDEQLLGDEPQLKRVDLLVRCLLHLAGIDFHHHGAEQRRRVRALLSFIIRAAIAFRFQGCENIFV